MTDQLKIFIHPNNYDGFNCIDDNYDGSPDSGWQPIGSGRTKVEALADYFMELEDHELLDADTDYVISGKDLK